MKVKKEIDEITVMGGVMDRDIEEDLYILIDKKIKKNEIIKTIRKFAFDEFFLDLEISDKKIYSYWNMGGQNADFLVNDKKLIPLTKKYFWSSFMYRIVKNNFKLQKYDDISFLKSEDNYFFFDDELKDYIGFISCFKLMRTQLIPLIKKSALCVSTSAIDSSLKGKGYGKKMYLAVINDAGCLLSDTVLYGESLNIWVNILPKFVKYVGYIDDSNNLKKIRNATKVEQTNIVRFFATNDISYLKAPIT